MGSTVWCDKCKKPFEETQEHYLVVVDVTRAGLYGGESFALDAHKECAEDLVFDLKELHDSHRGNALPE